MRDAKVEQLSVFLENKAGRLAKVTRALSEAGINIRALSLADTSDFGILRLIVSDYEKAKNSLKGQGFTVGLTSVIAVEVADEPGGLDRLLQLLGDSGINLEYMYAFARTGGEKATLILRLDKMDRAVEVLRQNCIPIIPGVALYDAWT